MENSRSFEPRWPLVWALGFSSLWIFLLSLPMWTGAFLAGPFSDQYATGYAYRHWAAEQFKATHHLPLWNPEIFGGLPFVAATHGEIFYPTAWLRVLIPTATAMNLAFAVHYVLAGLFAYLFLRLLDVSWTGSVVGATVYQLSGVVLSYVQPGHDGKLFVTALFPLALIAVVLAIRKARVEGYPLLALVVGLGLLAPHFQMLYYLLVATGLFALYLGFGDPERPTPRRAAWRLGWALVAILVGFGIGMIQVLPFYQYIPFSPRAEGYYGFEGATSYAIPWTHVPEFFLSGFVGSRDTYWGPNPLKLHSEYLGLPAIALAAFGAARRDRRRLALWLGGIGLLFLLVCLGAGTPFYRLWWEVMPFMKKVRAPGMALYIVAFVVAVGAALGVERLERQEGKGYWRACLVGGALVALLGMTGVVGAVAESLAQGVEMRLGTAAAAVATSAQGQIRFGALSSGISLALVGLVGWATVEKKLKMSLALFPLILLVGADLWQNGRSFWTFSRAPEELYRLDPVTQAIRSSAAPYRVLNLDVYPGSSLMAENIPQLLGHHGNELRYFDDLLGGKNQWRNLGSSTLWDLFAVRFLVLPARPDVPDSFPGYTRILERQATAAGVTANLFRQTEATRYARLVPAAVKIPDEMAVRAMVDPRFAPDRVVLLPPDAPVEPAPVSELPEAVPAAVTFDEWRPGFMRMRISPPAPSDAYLLVGENWYRDWKGTVDGSTTPVLRGDVSLLTVPVPQGAEWVELVFDSPLYRRGRLITLASLGAVILGLMLPAVLRRRGLG